MGSDPHDLCRGRVHRFNEADPAPGRSSRATKDQHTGYLTLQNGAGPEQGRILPRFRRPSQVREALATAIAAERRR